MGCQGETVGPKTCALTIREAIVDERKGLTVAPCTVLVDSEAVAVGQQEVIFGHSHCGGLGKVDAFWSTLPTGVGNVRISPVRRESDA